MRQVSGRGGRRDRVRRRGSRVSGAWIIHPVLILLGKVLVGAIPGMTQDLSWTVTNLGYMAVILMPVEQGQNGVDLFQVSFLMFHHVTGVPFEQS